MKPKNLLLLLSLPAMLNYRTGHAQPVTVNIDLSNSVTAMIQSAAPADHAPGVPDLGAFTWNCDSTACVGRTLMSIDLSQIPPGSQILHATLSLFADTNCTYIGFYGLPTYGTYNRGTIRRITSPWNPDSVSWNNKPSRAFLNQLIIRSSKSDHQDYPNLDATALINDMMNYPSYGIALQMNDEVNYYKSLIFGSNLNPHNEYKPKLVVTYKNDSLGNDSQKISANPAAAWEAEIFGNPASDKLVFEFSGMKDGDEVQLSVFNATGQLIRKQVLRDSVYTMNVAPLNAGLYFYVAENKTTNSIYSGKFTRQ